MDIFSANTDVTMSVPLADKSGNVIAVTSILYRVIDASGAEILPETALTDFVAGSDHAIIVIPAEKNALGDGQPHDMRQVTLVCSVGLNTSHINAFYAIQADDALISGVNSFMTYIQAQFVALTMPNIDGWNNAAEQERLTALIEAKRRILRLSFVRLSRYLDQDSMFYGFEGARDVSWIGGDGISADLSLLRPEQYARLPVEFIAALRNAQLCEANEILGGSSIDQKRREGLIQDNIGESRQMFRIGKPLDLPVARSTMKYLSGYVGYSIRLGRA